MFTDATTPFVNIMYYHNNLTVKIRLRTPLKKGVYKLFGEDIPTSTGTFLIVMSAHQ